MSLRYLLPPPLAPSPDSRESDSSSVSSLIQVPPDKSDQCEACRSIPINQPGFVSYDTKANICYISQQHPEQPQLYSVVRQACVRRCVMLDSVYDIMGYGCMHVCVHVHVHQLLPMQEQCKDDDWEIHDIVHIM